MNGLRMDHEAHGAGEMFGRYLAALAADREVIAAHLQGHRHTADIDRPPRLRGHGG